MEHKRLNAGIVIRKFKGLSGAVNYAAELARRLPAHGFDMTVLAQRADAALAAGCGAQLRKIPSLPFGWPGSRALFSAAAGWRSRGLDLVHGQGDTLSQDVLSLHNCVHAAHEAVYGTPLPEGNGVGRLHERQLRERRFGLLVANSSLMKQEVARRFGVPADLIRVVYPGMDPARFAAKAPGLRAELGFSPADVIAGLVTSGDLAKRGAGAFLKALARARGDVPALKGLIVAGAAQAAELRPAAAALGLSSALVFTAPRPEVERLYATIDFMAYPALYEEFGITVLEACACGLPVLLRAARVGAAETLAPALRAELDFSGDEELAAKMAALASSPEKRAALGAAARACALPVTWDAAAAAVAAVYREALAQKLPR
ncbi:MAG: glycosyltransferase family 4 protein [Elusimicrobiales bacterium]|nr:glycosyltransferase family 4 protein [Elusimicrobiales bacterium]